MEEQFLSYELSLIAKEKGFDEPCLAWYTSCGDIILCNQHYMAHNRQNTITYNSLRCAVPLYQQIINWFRDKHSVDISVKILYSVNEPIDMFGIINFTINEFQTPDIIVRPDEWISYNMMLNLTIERAFKCLP